MTVMALLTVAGLFFLFLKFGTKFLKRLIGMDSVADIGITVFLVAMFGITATFSGMMVGIIAGVIISVILLVSKRIFPHEKLERVDGKWRWVEKRPAWMATAKKLIDNKVRKEITQGKTYENM